jgi:hypothetical protein
MENNRSLSAGLALLQRSDLHRWRKECMRSAVGMRVAISDAEKASVLSFPPLTDVIYSMFVAIRNTMNMTAMTVGAVRTIG